MKRFLIALAMIAVFIAPTMAKANLYRHNPQVMQDVNAADTSGIAVYSDTTSSTSSNVVNAVNSAISIPDVDDSDPFDDITDPFQLLAYLTGMGILGVVVAFLVILLIFFIIFSPIILIIVILVYLFRRNKAKYRVVEKAIESGQSIPQELIQEHTSSKEYLRQRGIKTAAVGLGLVVFGLVIRSSWLIAIGLLVAIYGGGQIVIALTSKDNKYGDKDEIVEDDVKNESSEEQEQ